MRLLVLMFNIIITFIIFFVIGEVKDNSSNVDGNITLEEAEKFFNLSFEGSFPNFLL